VGADGSSDRDDGAGEGAEVLVLDSDCREMNWEECRIENSSDGS